MAYSFATNASMLFLLLLCESLAEVLAQGYSILSVTRHEDGDEYRINRDGECVDKLCPNNYTLVFGNCTSDHSLRNQSCVGGNDQFFLGIDSGIEPNLLVAFGSNGILKAFNQQRGTFEDGIIVERNTVNNLTEKQSEYRGQCNITSLSLVSTIQDNVSEVNHSGFNFFLTSGYDIKIAVNEEGLHNPKSFYEGKIFRLKMNCLVNTRLDCIVFKFNGIANFNEDNMCLVSTTSQVNSQFSPITTITVAEITSGSTNFWEDPTIQYIMIGSGCGIGLLICVITILCIGICTLSAKSKNTAVIHARRMELKCNATQDSPNDDKIDMNQNSSYVTLKLHRQTDHHDC